MGSSCSSNSRAVAPQSAAKQENPATVPLVLSAELLKCISAAKALVGEGPIFTEHVLWSVLKQDLAGPGASVPHIVGWLANSGVPVVPLLRELEIIDLTLKDPAKVAAFTAALAAPVDPSLAVDEYADGATEDVAAPPKLDPALALALHLAKEAVSGDAPITTDALVLTMLQDTSCGASIAIHTVAHATHSIVTTEEVAEEMGLNPSSVIAAAESATQKARVNRMGWTVFHAVEGTPIVPPLAPIAPGDPLPPLPLPSDTDVRVRMAGPTPDCAKLVPCFPEEFSPELPSPPGKGFARVLMGRFPVAEEDLRHLLEARVSVFVNLREELPDSMYTGDNPTEYPSIVKRLIATEFPTQNVTFIHFKILDFNITAPGYMLELIRELEKLVYAGHVIYIHCAGGHGRTGQVAINTLEALYALDLETAQKAAITFHQGRTSGKCAECHELPEMPIQEAQLKLIAPMAARERALMQAMATPTPLLLHEPAHPRKKNTCVIA